MRPVAASHSLTVDSAGAGLRLDVFLAQQEGIRSRAEARRLIDAMCVQINGTRPQKAGQRLVEGDRVDVSIPVAEPTDLAPEPIPLDVLFEDEWVLVINKPKGLVVHPAPGHQTGTLVHALIHHLPELPVIGGAERPGIVHRLDKDTTGALVVAKTEEAHVKLAADLKARRIKRVYIALVHGNVRSDAGSIDAPIGRHPTNRKRMAVVPGRGRPAVTHFETLERFGRYTLLQLRLETGRTHQIRVHLAHIGHPVVGDTVYGPNKPHLVDDGQALHAVEIAFFHPITGELINVRAPIPEGLQRVLSKLRLDG